MPVKIRKTKKGYRVTHGGKVSAKHTTKVKAKRQSNLLLKTKFARIIYCIVCKC